MKHKIRDFEFELIDDPKQRHVVAWEIASRSYRNEDAKPRLKEAIAELKKLSVTEVNPAVFVQAYHTVSRALTAAFEIINDNETITVSANHGIMVKAAVKAGWIVSPQLTEEQIDEFPAWKVMYIAEQIGMLYLEVTTIPKN